MELDESIGVPVDLRQRSVDKTNIRTGVRLGTLSLKQRENDLLRRTGKLLASLAIAGAVVFGAAGPAQASGTYNNVCDSQEFCLFNEANFQGFYVWDTMDMENENYQGWRYPGNGPGINDNSWSLKNRGWWYGIDSCVDSYWRGPCFSTSAGYSRSDLWSINGLSFADKLSSHY
ncbi:MAG TPA: hypothetical protein DGG94_11035 [Micromonosporaceae bacterium]|nr:hypothetical protein [Micromonosporaceae bacterium]HCU50314.1 hypothetical protein [Micromonosporaceae bacterium]